jgi:hypothetical protein
MIKFSAVAFLFKTTLVFGEEDVAGGAASIDPGVLHKIHAVRSPGMHYVGREFPTRNECSFTCFPLETSVVSDPRFSSSFMQAINGHNHRHHKTTLVSSGEDGGIAKTLYNFRSLRLHRAPDEESSDLPGGCRILHSKRVYFYIFPTRSECSFGMIFSRTFSSTIFLPSSPWS